MIPRGTKLYAPDGVSGYELTQDVESYTAVHAHLFAPFGDIEPPKANHPIPEWLTPILRPDGWKTLTKSD